MPKLKVPLCILTGLVLLSSCSVKIKDAQFCAPIPGHLGAVCDNFLTSNQLILDEAGWQALQAQWIAAGQATECTQAQTLGDLKSEIEKLCSLAPCNYQVKQKILKGLTKLQSLGSAALAN